MSSSSGCQGLQSCLEPGFMEKNNTTIIKTNNKINECDMKSERTEEMGGWSFLQSLNNTKNTGDYNEKVYVHPLVKLSEKSLEMCTESLGSESSDGIITTISSSPEITTTGIINYTSTVKLRGSNLVKKRTNRSVSFPPPLTSICGSSVVQVRPHREGGRLVLQAVTTVSSSPTTYFHAERGDGRLRLCLVKDLDRCPNEDEDVEEGEEQQEEEEVVYEDEEEEEDVCCDDGQEGVEGKCGEVRGEIGIENLPRPSRCKEGGRGDGNKLIWEQYWVAT